MAKVTTEGSAAPPASSGAPRRFQPSAQNFSKASLNPGGVRTTPFSSTHPCSSPTWFSGCRTSSQNFAPPSRIAPVVSGVRIAEARHIGPLVDAKQLVKQKQEIFHRGLCNSASGPALKICLRLLLAGLLPRQPSMSSGASPGQSTPQARSIMFSHVAALSGEASPRRRSPWGPDTTSARA